jgi:anti-sigma regulatory factor (Ser/Thr protein kinase)
MSTFTRTIHTNSDEAHALREESLVFFREQQGKGLAARVDEYFFRLAVDETLSNAMHHGNGNDENKKIHVRIEIQQEGGRALREGRGQRL